MFVHQMAVYSMVGFAALVLSVPTVSQAQTRATAPSNRAEIKRLERKLADLKTKLSSANGEYDRILTGLKSNLDRIDRIRTTADLAASALSLQKSLKSFGTSRNLAKLNRSLLEDLIGDLTGVTTPSFWSSVGEAVYNRVRSGELTTARSEIERTISRVNDARFQTGIGYVRLIQQTQSQLRDLRGW